MIKEGHLETYKMIITTKSPVFVGSGRSINKTEYCFIPENLTANMIDNTKLLDLIMKENIIEAYEKFIMKNGEKDLRKFLNVNNVSNEEIKAITTYETFAGDALDDLHTISNINCFQRNSKDKAYIPGSSIKGALRTAILVYLISQNKLTTLPYISKDNINTARIEEYYLSTLNFKTQCKNSQLSSIMRGISISDSELINDKDMVLCKKQDVSTVGTINIVKNVRECIKPYTSIVFSLTIDKSIMKEKDINFIKNAIAYNAQFYKKTYVDKRVYPSPNNSIDFSNTLIIGGGSGYYSKNIIYALLGKPKAVLVVTKIMESKFKCHRYKNDDKHGISPRMMKYTTYKKGYYHFGLCTVNFQ